VQLDAGVIRTGESAYTQAAGWHFKIPSVLLHLSIVGNFGGAEKRVLRLVDRDVLSDAVFVRRIGINPTETARNPLRLTIFLSSTRTRALPGVERGVTLWMEVLKT